MSGSNNMAYLLINAGLPYVMSNLTAEKAVLQRLFSPWPPYKTSSDPKCLLCRQDGKIYSYCCSFCSSSCSYAPWQQPQFGCFICQGLRSLQVHHQHPWTQGLIWDQVRDPDLTSGTGVFEFLFIYFLADFRWDHQRSSLGSCGVKHELRIHPRSCPPSCSTTNLEFLCSFLDSSPHCVARCSTGTSLFCHTQGSGWPRLCSFPLFHLKDLVVGLFP